MGTGQGKTARMGQGWLGLWCLLTFVPMVALPVYLPVSAIPTMHLGDLHQNPAPLTAVVILAALGSTFLAGFGRKRSIEELRRVLGTGMIAAWIGAGVWVSYVHFVSELDTGPKVPEVGDKAPDFSVALPADFQVQIPMFPIPVKPKPFQLSAMEKKKRPVLLVFYRAHW